MQGNRGSGATLAALLIFGVLPAPILTIPDKLLINLSCRLDTGFAHNSVTGNSGCDPLGGSVPRHPAATKPPCTRKSMRAGAKSLAIASKLLPGSLAQRRQHRRHTFAGPAAAASAVTRTSGEGDARHAEEMLAWPGMPPPLDHMTRGRCN